MKKQKGMAIPSVIAVMSVVVCFSLLLITLVVGSNISTRYQTAKLEKQILTNQMKADFVDNQTLDNNYDYDYIIIENENNSNQKALVVKKSNKSDLDLYFLFVYDFEEEKILASQTQSFSISTKQIGEKTFYYLADIIKYKEI